MTDLPAPIRLFIEHTNRGDPKAVVDCFTADAVLTDWGRRFEGREGVACWDSTDNTGVRSHMEVAGSKPSKRGWLLTSPATASTASATRPCPRRRQDQGGS